jgi:hypothetical protein
MAAPAHRDAPDGVADIVIDGDDGRPLALARIDVIGPLVVRAALHVEPGQLPAGTRTRLVDAVFDDPQVRSRRQVQVTLPLGDTEILDRVRQRGSVAEFRAAGSTCLLEAEVPAPPVGLPVGAEPAPA